MRRMRRFGRAIAAIAAFSFGYIAFLYLTLPDVRELRTKNLESTAFMDLRAREARAEGRELRRVHQWVPYSRISPHLKRAVLVAEDAGFWGHEGIDLVEIRKALESAESVTQMRGASTITQQLAKNLYLSPSRNPFRKLRELLITWRLEHELSKTRIFELYLNNIEWGDGIWGAEAAARTYFGIPASAVSPDQAALMAGAIINPRVLNIAQPNARLRARQRIIRARMGNITPPPVIARPAPAEIPALAEPEPEFEPEEAPTPESTPDAVTDAPAPTSAPDGATVGTPTAPVAPAPDAPVAPNAPNAPSTVP
ncbi:MAG TPA: monofunctional biosynthetic peptidoglycan transglycosylase [Vicinamibacterales bacterium]|nr:monofunctional biosynthetic peptidoglycan transglycosylase [Vicinamibacterales bacterium]